MSLNFTPAFLHRFKHLEPMLSRTMSVKIRETQIVEFAYPFLFLFCSLCVYSQVGTPIILFTPDLS